MNKRNKWFLCAVGVVFTILHASIRNWDGILWIWYGVFMTEIISKDREQITQKEDLLQKASKEIRELSEKPDVDLRTAEAKQTVYLANCEMLLKRCKYYRQKIEQLETLNRNLINHYNEKPKNYAAKSRKSKDGNPEGTR